VRNRTLMLLFAVTGFRLRTLSQLNYTGDTGGHLFLQKGRYTLKVPRTLFKVEDGPFFGTKHARTDYIMDLPNVYGLYELLDEYLTVSHPWFMSHVHRGCKEQPLFLSSHAGKSARLNEWAIYQTYRKTFERYLVENRWRGTGMSNVRATGAHSVRHIRATSTMKRTGSFQLAADSIHNSEKMARAHYARFMPTDRNERVNETLFGETKKASQEEEEKKEEEGKDK
jgi:hypothetical protein